MNGFTLTCLPTSFSASSTPTTALALIIWLRCGDSFISMVAAITLIMGVGRLPLLYVSEHHILPFLLSDVIIVAILWVRTKKSKQLIQ
jgi:hypothetical protein